MTLRNTPYSKLRATRQEAVDAIATALLEDGERIINDGYKSGITHEARERIANNSNTSVQTVTRTIMQNGRAVYERAVELDPNNADQVHQVVTLPKQYEPDTRTDSHDDGAQHDTTEHTEDMARTERNIPVTPEFERTGRNAGAHRLEQYRTNGSHNPQTGGGIAVGIGVMIGVIVVVYALKRVLSSVTSSGA